jgi:hypothetical protein
MNFFCFFLIIALSCIQCTTCDDSSRFLETNQEISDLKAWNAAMDEIFVLDSGSSPISNHERCNHNIKNLLLRQNYPLNVTQIKNMDLTSLYKFVILASISGISHWKRNPSSNKIILTDNGYPIHPSSPINVESDIMTCIICALLIVIATFHLMYSLSSANGINATSGDEDSNKKGKE